MTKQEKDTALARLNTLLRARDGKPGYKQNVAQIKSEIEALKAITVSE